MITGGLKFLMMQQVNVHGWYVEPGSPADRLYLRRPQNVTSQWTIELISGYPLPEYQYWTE